MEKHVIDLLTKQVQDISHNKQLKTSDKLDNVTEEIKNLQDSIYQLSSDILESNRFLSELSQGNLDAVPPSKSNFISGYLKELHAVMIHIAWQAEQVAEGDYSQEIKFMGKLSNSFNIMIQQLRERKASLVKKSYTDELTGVYNRRYCKETIKKFIAANEDFSFVMIDIDRLKKVNDKFGHCKGDEYINIVTKTINENIESEDVLCRVAGDEFAIIFKNRDEKSSEKKMNMIWHKIQDIKKGYTLSISYGIIYVPINTNLNKDDIFELSDVKMYEFKNNYRINN
jgi:diguanylate cyclase (GGDEF)-like protein